jgi:type IV pilus assembly protein PilW
MTWIDSGQLETREMFGSNRGLTLIELLIALALAAVVTGACYQLYQTRLRSHVAQELIVDMQQSVRAAAALMKREIRMAGYNPAARDGVDNDGANGIDDPAESPAVGIEEAAASKIHVSFDYDGDMTKEGVGEDISYGFAAKYDGNGDGIADSGSAPLGRKSKDSALYPMAENIQAIRFAYAFDYDDGSPDGRLDQSPNGHVIWAYDSDDDKLLDRLLDTNDDGVINAVDQSGQKDLVSRGWTAKHIPLAYIRSVRAWILARTRAPVPGHYDHRNYAVGDVIIASNDRYMRQLLTITVYCRNLGID